MESGEKLIGIREEELVPGVARPAQGLLCLIGFPGGFELIEIDMPAHIDDEDIEGDIVLMEAADDLFDLLVGVVPVAGPPGAKGETRREWDAAGDADVVTE